ncbi:MAG: hypothetical protein QXT84_00665 [Candidatus Bathyarchaeia archaeon]
MKVAFKLDRKYDMICTVHGDVCTRYEPDYDGMYIYEVDAALIGYVYFKNSKTGEIYWPQLIYKFTL